jgi:hypothetical protein
MSKIWLISLRKKVIRRQGKAKATGEFLVAQPATMFQFGAHTFNDELNTEIT